MSGFSWTNEVDEARAEQLTLRNLVSIPEGAAAPIFSRGLAIGTAYDENSRRAIAIGFIFDESGRLHHKPVSATIDVDFPYMPGLLAFRVGPAICKVLDDLNSEVDLLLIDGQGIAHPRGIGLASHIGVLYNKVSIGVTKNNLFGHVFEPPNSSGSAVEIFHPRQNSVIGYSLVPSVDCAPIYVSPGHAVSPSGALTIIRKLTKAGSCFPTALAKAHGRANAMSRKPWREPI